MEIKILGICGSPIKKGNTEAFLGLALGAAAAMGSDVKTEMVTLGDKRIRGCKHCHWCEDHQEEGKPPCAIKDDMVEIYPKLFEADGLLLATPVYGGRLSGYMATFLDRTHCLSHSNYFQGIMTNKPCGGLVVLWFRDAGAETTLQTLMWSALTKGMIPACGYGSRKFGAVGLSSPGGTGVFENAEEQEDRLNVLRDKHGCQSARIIGRRVVFLARAMKPVRMELGARNATPREMLIGKSGRPQPQLSASS